MSQLDGCRNGTANKSGYLLSLLEMKRRSCESVVSQLDSCRNGTANKLDSCRNGTANKSGSLDSCQESGGQLQLLYVLLGVMGGGEGI